MKIVDGKDAILGRLASYVAKEAMRGEEVAVINCEQVKITGRRLNIVEHFLKSRTKVGTGQQGPKISRLSFKIVKRAIRGMLPEHREGRGRVAWKKIKCYNGTPKEFENSEKISLARQDKKGKFIRVEELSKL
jgi:large subunit ribosomal protein L13